MARSKYQIIILVLRRCGVLMLLCRALSGSAQSAQPAFFHYTTEDGLPSLECYEIIQDSKGYIWTSTDNGVSRFDGYKFKNYGTEEGLKDKTVLILKEDHQGWIWMSTFSGNFYIFRGDTIAPYEHNEVLQNIRSKYYLVENFVITPEEEMIASLKGYNVCRIDRSGEIEIYFQRSIIEEGYHSIYKPPGNDTYLFLSRELNFQLEDQSVLAKKYWQNNLFPFHFYDDIHSPAKTYRLPVDNLDRRYDDSGGNINVQQLNQGLFIQHFDSLFYLPDPGQPEFLIGRSPQHINCVYSNRDSTILVGYNGLGGLKRYSSVQQLLDHRPQNVLLEGYSVTHALTDKWGGLWVATLEDGIFYAPVPEHLSNTILSEKEGDVFNRITLSNEEGILVAQASGNIFQVNDKLEFQFHSKLETITSLNGLAAFPDFPLLVISPLRYWKKTRWIDVFKNNAFNSTQAGIGLQKVERSRSKDRLWGVNGKRGIYILAQVDGKIEVEKYYSLAGSNKMTSLQEDRAGNIWLGGLDGLFKLDLTTERPVPKTGHPIYRERVEDIQLLPGGGIAVATRGSGIYLLRDGELTIWSVTDGLGTNTINQLNLEGDILWALGINGLNRIPLKDGIAGNYVFTKKDGLPSAEISDLVFVNGYIYLVSQNSITRISNDKPVDATPLPLYVEGVSVNGRTYSAAALQHLDWQERNIQLDYHLLDYAQAGEITYRFRLAAAADWLTTTNNSLDLLNLNPGNYTLEIEAKNKAGEWVAAAPLPLHISPPFWQTIWFISACILAGLIVIYYLFRSRLRTLARERERSLLQEQVSELQQQAYRAQMNPHFIFNCLNTIQGMIVGDDTEQEAAVRMVARFSQLIRAALDASAEGTVTLDDEVSLLTNYLDLERIRFNQNFSYKIEIDPMLERDWVRLPPMLVQPFVENAVLHGMEYKRGDGLIVVSYTQYDQHLKVTIFDNGPGIAYTKALKAEHPSKYGHKSLGMTITGKRLAILNQNDYEVQLEEPQDAAGEVTGTRVTIYIPIN